MAQESRIAELEMTVDRYMKMMENQQKTIDKQQEKITKQQYEIHRLAVDKDTDNLDGQDPFTAVLRKRLAPGITSKLFCAYRKEPTLIVSLLNQNTRNVPINTCFDTCS